MASSSRSPAEFEHLNGFFECVYWVFLNTLTAGKARSGFARNPIANGGVHGARGQTCRDWAAPRRRPTAALWAGGISELFRRKEARGEHCVMEQFRRGDKEYYFAYAQDHRQISLEYAGGCMTNRPHRPAFEIIFIHDDIRRTLSIWHQGRMERVQDLQVAFAGVVLGAV